MNIFFDFDDVLFHTGRFREDLGRVFEACGAPIDLYEEGYRAAHIDQGENGGTVYALEKHLSYVRERCACFDIPRARQMTLDLAGDTRKYVFSDVYDFLRRLHAAGHALYVVTLGTVDFQMLKLRHSGLMSFFKEVFIVDSDKYVSIRSVTNEKDGGWFFEDRSDYLKNAEDTLPWIKTVQVCRPEGRYTSDKSDLADYRITCFEEMNSIAEFREDVGAFEIF